MEGQQVITIILAIILWLPDGAEYTLAAQPTSPNTEEICFYEVDQESYQVLSSLGCVGMPPNCFDNIADCRVEHTITLPVDGRDRYVMASAKNAAGESMLGGDTSGAPGRVVLVPAVPLLVQ
jgi:hypothetical protein